MSEITWIKLKINTFEDEKIRIIDTMPERDAILVIFIKLLLRAGQQGDGGYISLENKLNLNSDEILATIFNRPVNIIRLALSVLQKMDIIECGNHSINILNFEKHQNTAVMLRIREGNRLRQQRRRDKIKLLEASPSLSRVTNAKITPTEEEEDKEKDIDIEKEEDKDTLTNSPIPPLSLKEKSGFQIYEENIGQLTPIVAEKLKVIVKSYPENWFKQAVEEACKYNKRSLPYIEAILRNWEVNGVKNGNGKNNANKESGRSAFRDLAPDIEE